MVEFKAVEDRWPHEARADYPELNTAIRRTDSDGRVWIIARCMNASIANRIACALNNCGYGPGEEKIAAGDAQDWITGGAVEDGE